MDEKELENVRSAYKSYLLFVERLGVVPITLPQFSFAYIIIKEVMKNA